MTGDDADEHTFMPAWLRYVARIGLVAVAFVAACVFGLVHGDAIAWPALGVGLLGLAVHLLTVARRLVRSASFDGHRLRATTLTGRHEVDAAALTAVEWSAGSDGRALISFAGAAGRVRFRGGELLIPMPAGADLLRALEEAHPAGPARTAAPHSHDAREFDFSASCRLWQVGAGVLVVAWLVLVAYAGVRQTGNPWIWAALVPALGVVAWLGRKARSQFVRRAVLDGSSLRATTADGLEHVLDVDDIDVDDGGLGARTNHGFGTLRHPDTTLRLLQPAGTELLDRLRATHADRD